jgi:hypothetical protein
MVRIGATPYNETSSATDRSPLEAPGVGCLAEAKSYGRPLLFGTHRDIVVGDVFLRPNSGLFHANLRGPNKQIMKAEAKVKRLCQCN